MHGEENEDAERVFYERGVSSSAREEVSSNERCYPVTEGPQPTSLCLS